MRKEVRHLSVLAIALLLTSCTYNPFSANNHTTGSPLGAVTGAAIGAGGVAWMGGSKPLMVAAGLAGGAIGYYVTTLRYDAGGVVQSGGQVYQLGQFVGIEVPADTLFEPNTAEFLPDAPAILDSVVAVLRRFPNNNILISGNSSGFGRARWERKLSEERARKVSAYLWNAGINNFKEPDGDVRKLNYVGYGDYFPVSHTYTNTGIRANSRIQITSYPSGMDLHCDRGMHNIGSIEDPKLESES